MFDLGPGLFQNAAGTGDRTMTFQVGEETSDIFEVTFDYSNRRDVGESDPVVDLDSIVAAAALATDDDVSAAWAGLTQIHGNHPDQNGGRG